MTKINWPRLLLGGLVAGFVINVLSAAPYWEGPMWMAAMERIGLVPPELTTGVFIYWIMMGFVLGIGSIWLYVAIRPRFGAGIKTALYTGLAVWFFHYLLPFISSAQSGILPARLAVSVILSHVVLMCLATVAGAWIYKEE